MKMRIFLLALWIGTRAFAQQGDKPGEEQKQLVPKEKIPPAPVLPPGEALKSFQVAPGFRLETVASEPLVQEPVVIAFDQAGRIWVIEMSAYMLNLTGAGEDTPIGKVVVLEDTDGDGTMDKRTVFLDGLLLPRALAFVRDGVLIAEPPHLWFCRDTNGDGKCDEKTEVTHDYGNQKVVEHTANGLLWALDNWIYSANYTFRFRWGGEDWIKSPTIFRGQWGITQDDFGRLYYNSNEDPVRADLIDARYSIRNANYPKPAGINVPLYQDKAVWPIRVNPGVNRGYRLGQLRLDGTLATFTSACAPTVYRGDIFPAEFRGNIFVCEPAGNLVRRFVLTETNGTLIARNAYERAEFLASTDERFRPVNLCSGPDGALYVVDMYHGLLQHKLYVTSYLRRQYADRGLDKPNGLGRIYRVVPAAKSSVKGPRLPPTSAADLVKTLSHPNGWWQDAAQRMLVERRHIAAVPALQALVATGSDPLGRLRALWTLEGLGELDEKTIVGAMADQHPKVRSAAIRLSERLLKTDASGQLLPALIARVADTQPDVQVQLMLTLGETTDPEAEQAMVNLLNLAAANLYVRDAALSGLHERELKFLQRLLDDRNWLEEKTGRAEMLRGLAKCVVVETTTAQINQLLELAAAQPANAAWRQWAILEGMAGVAPISARGRPAQKVKPQALASEPASLVALARSTNPAIRTRVQKISDLLTWPGKPGYPTPARVTPLTQEQQARFEAGKELYTTTCGACHQPHGKGQEGLAPPLLDSDWVLGSERRLVRIVLHGVRGPLNVKGAAYEMEMPPLSIFDDEQIAAILTYVRREWGHAAAPVDPETVKKIRDETAKREEAWTEKELLKIP
jgi:mono/diheme cytochrome c family protein/glucose/arabinose dehydrogenase